MGTDQIVTLHERDVVDLRREVELVRLDPQYRLVFGAGGTIDASPNVDVMERQIAAISPADAPNFRRFIEVNRVKLEKFRPCLENPYLGWADLFTPRMLSVLPYLRPHRSLDDDLRDYFKDDRIQHRLLVPVEVPRNVPIQLPEPVLDPVVPGVRIRRLPPDGRLQRRHRGDGPGRARSRRGDPPWGAGRADPLRGAARRRREDRGGGAPRRRRRRQRRLRARDVRRGLQRGPGQRHRQLRQPCREHDRQVLRGARPRSAPARPARLPDRDGRTGRLRLEGPRRPAGAVLGGLVKKISREARVLNVDSPQSLEAAVAALAAGVEG